MEEQITPAEFARRIKEKYPQYADIDDNELTQKMLTKFPQYASMVNMAPQEQTSLTPEQQVQARDAALESMPGASGILSYIPGMKDLQATVVSGLTETIPQTIDSFEQREKSKLLQKSEGKIQPKGEFGGVSTFYSEKAAGGKENLQQNLKKDIQSLEGDISKSKERVAKNLTGVVQDIRKIKNASDVISFTANAVGQGLYQLPMSILSGGTSSYLMEAASIYDEHIDKLAEDLNISREEVLKRGLDKPAAGEAFAVLAAGLDFISAGKVLKVFKSAIGKTLTLETLTEGFQDILEQTGSNVGTDRGLTEGIDLGRSASAAVAGGLGAGPFSFIGENNSDQPTKVSDIKASDISEPLVSTGDPDIDATIDELEKQSASYVNKVLDDVDSFEGSKIEEQLSELEKRASQSEAESQRLLLENFILQKNQEFNSLPVVPKENTSVPKGDLGKKPATDEKPKEKFIWTKQTGREKTINGEDWVKSISEWWDKSKENIGKVVSKLGIDKDTAGNWLNATEDEPGIVATRAYSSRGKVTGTFTLMTDGTSQFQKEGDDTIIKFDFDGNVIEEIKSEQVAPETIVPPEVLVSQGKQAVTPSPEFTLTPTVVNDKQANEFKFLSDVGEANGVIIGDSASILDIYANKDEEGNVKKGGNLYGKVITNLKDNGVKNLVVGAQSPATSAVLAKNVEKGILTIDPKGDIKVGDKTIHTRFTINDKQTKQAEVKQTEKQPKETKIKPIEQAIPKSVKAEPEVKTEPKKVAPIELTEAPPSEKEIIREKELKLQEKQKEKKLILQDKLEKQLDNANKRKPAAKLAAIEKIAVKADEAGLFDLRDKATTLADKELEAQAEKAEARELRIKRKTPKVVKPESEKVAPKVLKTLDKPVKGTLKEYGLTKTEATVKDVREAFLKEIAYARRAGDANYKDLADSYSKFREKVGLKPQSQDKILSEADKDHFKDYAEKRLKQESKDRGAINRKKAELAKQGATKEDIDKAQNELKEHLRKDFAKKIGFDPKNIDTVHLSGDLTSEELFEVMDNNGIYNKLEKASQPVEVTFDQYQKYIPAYQRGITESIYNSVKKNGKYDLKFYTVKASSSSKVGGLYLQDTKNKKGYVVLVLDELSSPIQPNVPTHELLHSYTRSMLGMLYNNNKDFKSHVTRTFESIRNQAESKIQEVLLSYVKNGRDASKLSDQDANILYSVIKMAPQEFLSTPNGPEFVQSLYAFTNPDELLSEAFSNPSIIELLSTIPSNQKTGGVSKSLFQQLYESILKWIKNNIPAYGNRVNNSLIDELLSTVSTFEEQFLSDATIENEMATDFSVHAIKNNKIPDPKGDLEKARKAAKKKITNNIAGTLEKRKEIKSQKDVAEYITRVNARLPKSKQLGDIYSSLIWKKIKSINKQRKDAIVYQKHFLTQAKNNPQYKLSKKYKQDVDDFGLVDINDLKYNQDNRSNEIGIYINGLGELAQNGFPSKSAYDIMINRGKVKKAVNDLVSVSDKVSQNYKDFIKFLSLGLFNVEEVSSASTYSSILGKYRGVVSDKIMNSIYGGAMRSMSQSTTEAHNFYINLTKIANKGNMSHKDLAKVGKVGGIFSTIANPNDVANWKAEILDNAKREVSVSKNKLEAFNKKHYFGSLKKSSIENEIKIAEDILSDIEKGKSIEKILSPSQMEIYKAIRDFADKNSNDFKRNSIGNWNNDSYVDLHNYFPKMAQGRIDGVDLAGLQSDELIRSGADNLMDAFSNEGGKYHDVYAKKSKAQLQRTNPEKGYFYESDALAIAQKWSKNLLYDMYGSSEFKAVNRVLKNPEFRKAYNDKIQNTFKRHLRVISGSNKQTTPETGMKLKGLMKFADKLYLAKIATSGQAIIQQASGVVATVVLSAHLNPITAASSFAKAVNASYKSAGDNSFDKLKNKYQEIIQKHGAGIQTRDIGFERYLDPKDYDSYILGRKGKSAGAKMEAATEWALRENDKLAARMVWFSAFFDAGGTLENPTEEAVIRAERVTGVLQNMSDVNFSAEIFHYGNYSLPRKLLMGMLYAFKSFAFNAHINLIYSTYYSVGKDRREARNVAAATLGSVMAYHSLQAAVIRPIYMTAAKALFGGDDDDDEDKKSAIKETIAEIAWELVPGPYMPSIVDNAMRYGFNKFIAPKFFTPEFEEYNAYRDSPIYAPTKLEDVYKSALGPRFEDIADILENTPELISAMGLAMQTEEFFMTMEQLEKKEISEEQAWMHLVGTLIATQAWFPMRGDATRLIDKGIQLRQRQYFKDKQLYKNGGVNFNSDYNTYDTPGYDFQDYSTNEQPF